MVTKTSGLLATLRNALTSARNDIETLRSERLSVIEKIEALRAAPRTAEEISRTVDAVLDSAEVAAREWASFSTLAGPDGVKFNLDSAFKHAPIGVLSILGHRDAMREQLLAEAIAAVPGKPISAEERTGELARLTAALHGLDVEEERFLRTAEQSGAPIARRADCDVALLLEEEV